MILSRWHSASFPRPLQERCPWWTRVTKRMGTDAVLNFKKCDVVAEIKRLTTGKGVDLAIESLGTQIRRLGFVAALRPGVERVKEGNPIFATAEKSVRYGREWT